MTGSEPRRRKTDTSTAQRVIAILWPSFLMAGVATVLVFTAFDPQDLALSMGYDAPVNRLGAYTIGFFLLWLLTLSSSMLTCYFQQPCHTLRRPQIHEQP